MNFALILGKFRSHYLSNFKGVQIIAKMWTLLPFFQLFTLIRKQGFLLATVLKSSFLTWNLRGWDSSAHLGLTDFRMCYAAENDGFLIAFSVTHGSHWMISKAVQSLGERCVFDAYPSLLIQKEQVNIIEERCTEVLADLVISTSNDQKSLVTWEESHLMTDSTTWGITLLFDLLPFCWHNFALNAVRFKILKLC